METIILNGGKYYITENPGISYRAEKGHILVYILPLKEVAGENEPVHGRRMFLREAEEGEVLPSLCYDSEILGSWRLMFVALDHAELKVLEEETGKEQIMAFAEKIGLRLLSAEDFEEELIERYNLQNIREEGYIYATEEEDKATLKQSAALIYNIFRRGSEGEREYVPVKNSLYNAAALLCRKEHIEIASLDRIREACGSRFSLLDISRISHFTVREVVLAGDWYKKDSGPLLAFIEENNLPVPCIPNGPKSYVYYDTDTGESHKLDASFAKKLTAKGYVFYRPFPQKKIGAADLVKFGIKKVYKSDIARLIFLALLGTLVGLLEPFLNEKVYDRYIPLGDTKGLFALGAVILSCSLGNITFTIVKNLAMFRSMNSMEYAVQNAALDRLFNLPESFLREYDAASLGERVMGIAAIYQVLADNITQTALTMLFSFIYLFRMFKYSKKMSWTALILLAVMALILMWLGAKQTKLEKEKREQDIEANSLIFQLLSGIEKIRISASENRAILKYLGRFTRSQSINAKKERTTNLVGTVAGGAPTVFTLIFYYMMIRKSLTMSLGEFSGFTSAFGSFSGAVFALVQSFLIVNMVKPIYEYVKPILDTLPENSEDAGLPGDLSGEVEMSHVTFAYNEGESSVLNDVNLRVKPGEYVAVVGPSGCGKSTLLKLLLGFEKPGTGKIFYDNRDIDEMDKRELRKKFGVVLQDGGLIAGSIYDNITITAPLVKRERVDEVIDEVGLKDDIAAMPMGLHTIVSEGAGTISGGQAQRILIARALVGKPKLIFLDEATSALDNVTQNMVVETLEKIKATKFVIAHRLSTVRRCDRIIVMDGGRIIEEGNYDSLMEKKGFFYDLAVRQMS
ncbi:MAG TPA: NHLP bacteriocin export ABC transporter permease/ATPase subunit [Lachnospiraceae bacterium]|nr:NHLP bacteriocin export ABC transporter permease/ATPase subunit [Lachnospiraceae bacterium]